MKGRPKKTVRMLLIEAKDPQKRPIEEILKDAYAKHKNMRQAGQEIGITHAAFSEWVYRLGIKLTPRNNHMSLAV